MPRIRISLPYGVGTISLLFDAAPSPEQLVDWYQTVTSWAALLPARDLGTKSVGVIDAAPGARLPTFAAETVKQLEKIFADSSCSIVSTGPAHGDVGEATLERLREMGAVPTPSPAPVTRSELRAAFTEYVNIHGLELAKSLLRTYGIERLAQLPPSLYIDFYQQMGSA